MSSYLLKYLIQLFCVCSIKSFLFYVIIILSFILLIIMALNPPITDDGEPYRIDYNETFFLQRKGIDFEVKVEGLGKMSGKGKVRFL